MRRGEFGIRVWTVLSGGSCRAFLRKQIWRIVAIAGKNRTAIQDVAMTEPRTDCLFGHICVSQEKLTDKFVAVWERACMLKTPRRHCSGGLLKGLI